MTSQFLDYEPVSPNFLFQTQQDHSQRAWTTESSLPRPDTQYQSQCQTQSQSQSQTQTQNLTSTNNDSCGASSQRSTQRPTPPFEAAPGPRPWTSAASSTCNLPQPLVPADLVLIQRPSKSSQLSPIFRPKPKTAKHSDGLDQKVALDASVHLQLMQQRRHSERQEQQARESLQLSQQSLVSVTQEVAALADKLTTAADHNSSLLDLLNRLNSKLDEQNTAVVQGMARLQASTELLHKNLREEMNDLSIALVREMRHSMVRPSQQAAMPPPVVAPSR
ncbi:uncharacterized protein MONBRDRAFT_26493 [Monosiga brevicollis MX1]|uniref:Uncharacterized protein n=1 Tax=Monosiga brevicollis TaxID=81824 RepID=A9V2I8_MONBE|nr:uncharacterized protein MONBRDRAFT_26493 [Monosiga brevicollis MX1]EDQ88264.1 predicted protein [Monosiga brevicollis MX1]|eukprot:XP_001746857.1 hypothetical protein [Monosiga brevicollis MX1]